MTKSNLTFSPNSLLWQINQELLIFTLATRAVLLEMAHPLVAQGISDHSNFRKNPYGRLVRTMLAASAVTFGTRRQGAIGAKHVHHCHREVKGTLDYATGPYTAGTPYDAFDPALRLWVFATLVDAPLTAYELFVAPLTPAEKRTYYVECKTLGRMLGVPPKTLPIDWPAFDTYYQDMLHSDTLTVGQTARELKDALFTVPGGRVIKRLSFISIGLLPARIRTDFGFTWTAANQAKLERNLGRWRWVRQRVPLPLAVSPVATWHQWRGASVLNANTTTK